MSLCKRYKWTFWLFVTYEDATILENVQNHGEGADFSYTWTPKWSNLHRVAVKSIRYHVGRHENIWQKPPFKPAGICSLTCACAFSRRLWQRGLDSSHRNRLIREHKVDRIVNNSETSPPPPRTHKHICNSENTITCQLWLSAAVACL